MNQTYLIGPWKVVDKDIEDFLMIGQHSLMKGHVTLYVWNSYTSPIPREMKLDVVTSWIVTNILKAAKRESK